MFGKSRSAMQSMSWLRIAKDARELAESDDDAATAKITTALNLPGKLNELQKTVDMVTDPNIEWLLARYAD